MTDETALVQIRSSPVSSAHPLHVFGGVWGGRAGAVQAHPLPHEALADRPRQVGAPHAFSLLRCRPRSDFRLGLAQYSRTTTR